MRWQNTQQNCAPGDVGICRLDHRWLTVTVCKLPRTRVLPLYWGCLTLISFGFLWLAIGQVNFIILSFWHWAFHSFSKINRSFEHIYGLPWWLAYQYRRPGFDLWVRKILWRRKWQTTLAFLPGKSHGQRRLAGCSPCGLKRVKHDLVWLNNHNKQAHPCICVIGHFYV